MDKPFLRMYGVIRSVSACRRWEHRYAPSSRSTATSINPCSSVSSYRAAGYNAFAPRLFGLPQRHGGQRAVSPARDILVRTLSVPRRLPLSEMNCTAEVTFSELTPG